MGGHFQCTWVVRDVKDVCAMCTEKRRNSEFTCLRAKPGRLRSSDSLGAAAPRITQRQLAEQGRLKRQQQGGRSVLPQSKRPAIQTLPVVRHSLTGYNLYRMCTLAQSTRASSILWYLVYMACGTEEVERFGWSTVGAWRRRHKKATG